MTTVRSLFLGPKHLNRLWVLTVLTLGVELHAPQLLAQSPSYRISDSIPVGRTSGDFYQLDNAHHRLYGAGPYVVDVVRKRVVSTIQDTSARGGYVIVSESGRGLVRDGTIFSLSSGAILGRLRAWGDASLYEPVTQRAFLLRDTVSVIDLGKGAIAAKLLVPGAAESGVVDGRGRVYVNLRRQDSIAVIDAQTLTVLTRYSVAPGKSPMGLSIDTAANRLFVACVGRVVVLDARTGALVTTIPMAGQSDQSAFDPVTRLLFEPGGPEGLTIIHENTPDDYSVVQKLTGPLVAAAKVVVDPNTHVAYMPHRVVDVSFQYVILTPVY